MLLPRIFKDKKIKVIAGLKASSQNSATCLSMSQPVSCAVAMSEGNTGRTRLSSSVLSTDMTVAPHTASAASPCKGAKAGYG